MKYRSMNSGSTKEHMRTLRALGGTCVACALALALGASPALAEVLLEEPSAADPAPAATQPALGEGALRVVEDDAQPAVVDEGVGVTDDGPIVDNTNSETTPATVAEEPATQAEPNDGEAADAPEATTAPETAEPGQVSEGQDVPAVTDEATMPENPVGQGESPAPASEGAAPRADDAQAASGTESASTGSKLKAQATATTTTTTKKDTLERPANGTYVIKMDGTQKLVLTVKGSTAKAGSNVVAASYTGKSGQKWVVVYDATRKRYRLFVSGTSRKLALGAKKSGKTVNVCVLSAKKASLKSILWTFVCGKDGAYRLANAAYKGKRLDVAGAKIKKGADVIIASRRATSSDATQRYVVYNTKPKVKAGKAAVEGSYTALLTENQKVCVGVKGASKDAGANVLLSAADDDMTQRIYLERDAKGFYSVWVIGSGKVLDVVGSSVLPGTNVQQAANAQKDNQKWAVVAKKNGDGTYTVTLQNKATGLFLGAAKKSAGTNLVGVDGRDATKLVSFRLKAREMLDAGIYEIKPSATSKVSLNVAHALADTAKKGSLILYTDKDSLAERFELVDAEGDNLWRVRTASSGGWVTWNGGTSVVQAGKGSSKATGANTWRLMFENGGFSLVNVASGKALEMKGGSKKSGTKIVAADPSGESAQIFSFEPSSLYGGRYVALQDADGKRTQVGSTDAATVKLAKQATYLAQMLYLEQCDDGWKLRDFKGRYVTTTGTAAKTDVVSKAATGKDDQLWQVRIADGGKVSFVSVRSGLALVAGTGKPQLGSVSSADAAWEMVDRTVDAMKERIAQVAMHFAEHDAHGYSQPNRGTGANEEITLQDGSKVTISSSDVDCSELVRQCANTVLGFDTIGFMWTGNQDELLLANGFVRMAFNASEVKRGDILWRSGHTGVALGSTKQAEALMDEYGGIYGYSRGDQTGHEVAINPLNSWVYIYRYVG